MYFANISNVGFDVDVILCCYANIKASYLREMPSSIMSLEVTKCDKLVRSILSELGILLSKTLGDSFFKFVPNFGLFLPTATYRNQAQGRAT